MADLGSVECVEAIMLESHHEQTIRRAIPSFRTIACAIGFTPRGRSRLCEPKGRFGPLASSRCTELVQHRSSTLLRPEHEVSRDHSLEAAAASPERSGPARLLGNSLILINSSGE